MLLLIMTDKFVAVQSIEDWYKQVSLQVRLLGTQSCPTSDADSRDLLQLPVVTRTYVTLCFLITAGCALEVSLACVP